MSASAAAISDAVLDPPLITDLNVALDEAVVQGVRIDRPAGQVRVLLQVLTLPAEGPADPDPRRAVILTGVSQSRVLLRRDRTGAIPFGPPIPLADQQALDDFFASLTFADATHGGRMLDDPSPTDDWPATPSLVVPFPAQPADHYLHWFTECGREEPGGTIGYHLEGLIQFDTLAIERADSTPVGIRDFAAAGRRWWIARHNNDPRVSARAQRQHPRPAWHG